METTRIDKDPILGALLGDALGLPAEGMSAPNIERRFAPLDRYHLLGGTGFVSADTEQSVLLARALAGESDDEDEHALILGEENERAEERRLFLRD